MKIKHYLYNAFIIESGKTKIAIHGPLKFKLVFGLVNKTVAPGPGERIGIGSTVFKVAVDGKTFVNMGDTLLLEEEWKGLEVVKLMSPRMVIPCHYDNDFLWIRKANPADDEMFKHEVEKLGLECTIMKYGDEILV